MELLILILFITLLIRTTSKLVNRKGQIVHTFTNDEPSHYTNIDMLLEDGIISKHEHIYLIDKINQATQQ